MSTKTKNTVNSTPKQAAPKVEQPKQAAPKVEQPKPELPGIAVNMAFNNGQSWRIRATDTIDAILKAREICKDHSLSFEEDCVQWDIEQRS